MAEEAKEEKQVEQIEQLKGMKSSLTAITQQLMLTNSSDSSFKEEFQKANSSVLQAILEGNKFEKTTEVGLGQEETKDESRWKGLLGHFGWAKKFQERSAKMAKVAAGSVVKFGKGKLASVQKFAGNMLDLLLKGLGLGILWALFKWLEDKDWETIVKTVKELVESIGIKWTTVQTAVEGIKTALTEWSGLVGGIWTTVKAWKTIAWIAAFAASPLALLWGALKLIFAAGGLIAGLLKIVLDWTKTLMFSETGPLQKVWKWIKTIFSQEGMMGKLFTWTVGKVGLFFGESGPLRAVWKWIKTIFSAEGAIGKLFVWTAGKLGLMFGETGPLRGVWLWVKNTFGAESKLAATWKLIKESKQVTTLFGEGSHFQRLIVWMKTFFGTEGKIASMYRTIKQSKIITTLFGEGSHLRSLMTWIGSFFGGEGKIAQAAIWVGGKVKLFKDYLMIGEAGKGGAISRLFSSIGGIFGGIGDGFKALQKAKWFTVLKGFLGGAAKVANVLLAPLRVLLLPLTWILGIGAAVIGFVRGFMGKEGVKDERTMATKITDGLKGAFKGILDFFVVDLVVMMEDAMNYFVDMWNNSWAGSFKQVKRFSFGKDLVKATNEMIGVSEQSNLSKAGEEINIDKILEQAGGKLVDKPGSRTGDRFEIGSGSFQAAIDKLDISGLNKMAERMEEMRKNVNIDLVAESEIRKALQNELAERMEETKMKLSLQEQNAQLESLKIEKKIPSVEVAQLPVGQGNINAPTTVVKNSGSTTMMMGSSSTDKSNWKYGMQTA